MQIAGRVLFVIVGFLYPVAYSQGSKAPNPTSISTQSPASEDYFSVSEDAIRLPIGYFLLIRKGSQIAAIKLDKRIGTKDSDLEYRSYFWSERQSIFSGEVAIKHRGDLSPGAFKGPGRGVYAYQSGKVKTIIGHWRFDSNYRQYINMSNTEFWGGVVDRGFEFAPTSATALTELDLDIDKLHWYRWGLQRDLRLNVRDLSK